MPLVQALQAFLATTNHVRLVIGQPGSWRISWSLGLMTEPYISLLWTSLVSVNGLSFSANMSVKDSTVSQHCG